MRDIQGTGLCTCAWIYCISLCLLPFYFNIHFTKTNNLVPQGIHSGLKWRTFKSKQSLLDCDALCARLVPLFWVQHKFTLCDTHFLTSDMTRLTRVHTSALRSLAPCKHNCLTPPVLYIWLVDCGVSKSSGLPAGTLNSHYNLLHPSCMRYPCKRLSLFQSQGCFVWVVDFSAPMARTFIIQYFIAICICRWI